MAACPNAPICEALAIAGLALSATNGLHATDRSDLPRGEWPVYVLDHSRELAAIDAAEQAISTGIGRECASCRTHRASRLT